ncbi:unnamed protein product [Rotaria sp. Silwood1]|nr:unnamed protein product [Rotaria sp. Silwood1]CAF1625352.1 unnamed protein product [Rotaria sp. Silwood1]
MHFIEQEQYPRQQNERKLESDNDLKDEKLDLEGLTFENRSSPILDLTGFVLTDQDIKNLANALQNNKTLTTLKVPSNEIGDKGVEYLADALQNNMALVVLDLNFNKIGDVGVQYLADAVNNNMTLTKLDMGSNKIGEKGCQNLANALRYNRAKDIYLHPEQFSVENNLLTPTMKSKRSELAKYFQKQIDEMYKYIE